MKALINAADALDQIEAKASQLKTLSVVAQGAHIDEISTSDIGHFFTVLIEIADAVLSNTATLRSAQSDEQ